MKENGDNISLDHGRYDGEDGLVMDQFLEMNRYGENFTSPGETLTESDVRQGKDKELVYWLEGVTLTTIAIAGIIGNCVSCVVLSRPEMRRSSFNQLLLVLAGYDIAYLMSSTLIFGIPNLSPTFRDTVHVFTLPFCYGIAHISRVGSALLTLSITIERYLAITKPFFSKMKVVKRSLIKFSVLFSVCYNIPRFFEFSAKKMEEQKELDVVETKWIIAPTELRKDPVYMKVYILWLKLILVELLPYILISVLNTVIIINTRKSSSQFERRSQSSAGRENRMVTILIIVVFFFITCQSFKLIPDIYEVIQCATGDRSPPECWNTTPRIINIISMVAHVCLTFNSSANFLIYVVWGTKFRRALFGLLKGWRTPSTCNTNVRNPSHMSFKSHHSHVIKYSESHKMTNIPVRKTQLLCAGNKTEADCGVALYQDTLV